MPRTSSQSFLRETLIRSDDTLVVSKTHLATKVSPLPNLADLIATLPFCSVAVSASHHLATVTDRRYTAKDILGYVMQKGAQASRLFLPEQTARMAVPPSYFTPKSIVSFIAEMIEPNEKGAQASRLFLHWNRHFTAKMAVPLFDQWAWGAHLRRAPRARRVRLRRKQPNQSNPTTWRLAAMNMAIRGIDFDFGKELADTFTRDQHPDAPNGSMALLLANGSMSSNSSGEGDIRRALIEADLVETAPRECALLKSEGISQVVSTAKDNMDALPGQLFTNTQVPDYIWLRVKNKHVVSCLEVSNIKLAIAA